MFNLNLMHTRLPSMLMALLLLVALALPVTVTQAQSDNPTTTETAFSTNTPTGNLESVPVEVLTLPESAAPVVIYQMTTDNPTASDDGQSTLAAYLTVIVIVVVLTLVAQTLTIRKDLAKSIPQEVFVLFFEQAMKFVSKTETNADDLMLKSVIEASGYTVVKQPDGSHKVVPVSNSGGYTPG